MPTRGAAGLCAWFCLDSAGSLASGNASNVEALLLGEPER
jgi:hypothetical protein